ncbi:hypothetical protein M8C21_008737, partial [Ambrosia artemisiifolia]
YDNCLYMTAGSNNNITAASNITANSHANAHSSSSGQRKFPAPSRYCFLLVIVFATIQSLSTNV